MKSVFQRRWGLARRHAMAALAVLAIGGWSAFTLSAGASGAVEGSVLPRGAATAAPAPAPPKRAPNIVVIVADDLGFSDLGAYGGEAQTPNLDALAARGARFDRYRTSPLCSPSRAMLLTGLDNHRAGVATIPEVLPPEQKGKPGYSLRLEPGATTLATRLRARGYRTYLSGKWHLGDRPQDLPNAHGFDRSFALDASGANNWRHQTYMPYYESAPWFEDGKAAQYPDGQYSSDVLVDRLITYLDADAGRNAPFFAYLAFQAVHIPIQAPPERTARYRDAYRDGWAATRARRMARLEQLGIIAPDTPEARPHPKLRTWDSLSADQKALSAGSMAVYAAMIEAMDAAIGRLLAQLEARGEADNTIVVFTSDNGPEPSDPLSQRGFDFFMAVNGYNQRMDQLGEASSLLWIGPEWAHAVAAPGGSFKFYTREGGVRVPLIIAGPGVQEGQQVRGNAFVTDVAPTVLELVGAPLDFPDAKSIDGRSWAPALSGAGPWPYGPADTLAIEVSGNAALIEGDLKLVRNAGAYDDGVWRLFDVGADPGETVDLSAQRPNDVARLRAAFDAYKARNGVLEMPPGYNIEAQIATNTMARLGKRYSGAIAMALAVASALALLLGVWLWRRRKSKAGAPA